MVTGLFSSVPSVYPLFRAAELGIRWATCGRACGALCMGSPEENGPGR